MSKKYFWLKLKEDFFQDKKMKKLRRIAGGDTFTIIYLKMQLLSLKNDGYIIFDDLTDEFYQEVALEIDEDEDNVKVTINYLLQVGLIEEVNEKSMAMIETISNIGKESESAARVRKLRERNKADSNGQKALQCNVTEVTCNTEKEKELELEKEKHTQQVADDFETFWSIYPKKVDKKKAFDKFKVKLKKHDFDTILKGAASYAKVMQLNNTDKQYIKGAAVFLNNENYLDDQSELLKTNVQANNTYKPWEVNLIEHYSNGPDNGDDRNVLPITIK